MKKLNLILSVISLWLIFGFSATAQSPKNYEFKNGNWFDGTGFKRKIFYAANGVFVGKRPTKIDETVDLKNGFVIPPFADAHTHNLDGTFNLEKLIKAYLEEGTFYVQVLGNYAAGAKQAKPFLNKPSSPDVVYANGSLTRTYGHPFMVYEPLALGIYSPGEAYKRIEEVKKSRLAENGAYWFLDSKTDVDAKWEKFLATKPDIVKIMLIDAENYPKFVNSDVADKGLSPEVAAYVVEKARQAGLRVYAHIETASDFRIGLKIGVDGFAHAPHYGWSGKIEANPKDDLSLEDIRLAARKKVVVIPTANIGRGAATATLNDDKTQPYDDERFPRVVERQKRLLNLMRRNGVILALGSDYYGRTFGEELWYLHDNKIFDNRTLLNIAVETTPQTIFPNRKIGKLREGYEANFLVLETNPLNDFKAVKNIRWRFKQGFFLEATTFK